MSIEQQHRQLVDKLIEGGVLGAGEVGDLVVQREEENRHCRRAGFQPRPAAAAGGTGKATDFDPAISKHRSAATGFDRRGRLPKNPVCAGSSRTG